MRKFSERKPFFFLNCCSYHFRLTLHCPVKNEKDATVLSTDLHGVTTTISQLFWFDDIVTVIHAVKESATYCDEQPEFQHVQATLVLITQVMTQKHTSHSLKPY